MKDQCFKKIYFLYIYSILVFNTLSKENAHIMQIYCWQQLNSSMTEEQKVSVITTCVSQRVADHL